MDQRPERSRTFSGDTMTAIPEDNSSTTPVEPPMPPVIAHRLRRSPSEPMEPLHLVRNESPRLSSAQWQEQAERLSLRVQELEMENLVLKNTQGGNGLVSSNTSSQSMTHASRPIARSASCLHGLGGYTGRTVREAAAASQRSRMKRSASAAKRLTERPRPGQSSRSMNASLSCNNLSELDIAPLSSGRESASQSQSTPKPMRKQSPMSFSSTFRSALETSDARPNTVSEDDTTSPKVTSPRSYFEAGISTSQRRFTTESRPRKPPGHKRPKESDIRIWVGTWNMGAADPFTDGDGLLDERRSASMIRNLVPRGYHIYVLGVQEGVSESVYHSVVAYLNRNSEGLRYFRMELKNNASMTVNKNHPMDATIDAVHGRGDGAFMGTKFTGMAVFCSATVRPYVRLIRAGVHKFHLASGSKGGVAVALLVRSTTMAFVNCHLDARSDGNRREQIWNLNANLGKVMGQSNFDLTEQFHHVVWMGDLNYRIVHVDAPYVLQMLEEKRTLELHEKFDGLLNDRRVGGVFEGFTEPSMFPDFYPTYKKIPDRGYVNDEEDGWATDVYRVLYKEPFYKGGKVKKRVPGWCDRILVHSLLVSESTLTPEQVLVDARRQLWRDNYRSVNNGEGMDVSDHSPVYATFTLAFRRKHDSSGTAEQLSATAPIKRRSFSSRTPNESLPDRQPFSSSSYFDHPRVVRQIHALRTISTVLRVFNLRLAYGAQTVVPKKTRLVTPLIGEDGKQSDVMAERLRGGSGQLHMAVNAVMSHSKSLAKLHMLVWVKHDSISGHCVLSLKRISKQTDGGEVKFRVPLYQNSLRLMQDQSPVVVLFSVRTKTFAK